MQCCLSQSDSGAENDNTGKQANGGMALVGRFRGSGFFIIILINWEE